MLERRRIFHHRCAMADPTLRPYPTKVLLAWAEAISGNDEFRDWLMGSEYPELGVFCHALHNEPTSRAWMRHAGHHVLIALLEQQHPNLADGLWAVFGIFATGIIQTICLQQYFHRVYRVSYNSMAALNVVIYDKSLVISNTANPIFALSALMASPRPQTQQTRS